VRERIEEDGLGFDDALRETAIQTVFTTHTPVEAGHDRFSPELVERQLGWLRSRLRIDTARFLAAGRVNPGESREPLTMTVLGLKASRHRNGVSSLHGHVARKMWNQVWPGRAEEDVPIGHVTNGVHLASWLAPSMRRLYDRHLGPEWTTHHSKPETWRGLDGLDEGELWETHGVLRRRLVEFVRRRVASSSPLDPDALTIGFARRFATYKRATLVLSDIDRLAELLSSRGKPVQLIFSGKAHPRDDGGKAIIRQIVELSRDRRFTGRLVFVEDYDINVARHLVQGVDLWLNTPLRPLEASGTSGQKVVLNGGLNLSVLDGWWPEAYDGENGFAIGLGAVHSDPNVQWTRDAEALHRTLEQEVLPLFFDIDSDGLPRRWVERMKRSIATLAWRFSADRMLIDYVNGCYLPAAGGVSMSMP
jgi:starch phosphorylase